MIARRITALLLCGISVGWSQSDAPHGRSRSGAEPTVILHSGESYQFVATELVAWSIIPESGSISATGLYTAPEEIPSQQRVVVTATDAEDPSTSADFLVLLETGGDSAINVAPATVELTAGQSQQFAADMPVTWSVVPAAGAISAEGLYTAPAEIANSTTITIVAVSAADSTVMGKAFVTLGNQPLAITPGSVTILAGQSERFSANRLVTWSLNPAFGSINDGGRYLAPAQITEARTVTVMAQSVTNPSESASAIVNLLQSQAGHSPDASGGISELRVEAISHSSAKIRFVTANPGANSSGRIDYGTTQNVEFRSPIGRDGNGALPARSRSLSGLRPATRYYFRPVVGNGLGQVNDSYTCPAAGTFAGFVCDEAGSLPYFTTGPEPAAYPVPPQLPQPVDTTMPVINGRTFTVAVDSKNLCTNFNDQLVAAAAADPSQNHQIVIPAGAICFGELTLPKKVGAGTIVIRPSTPDDQLPPPGTRIDPSFRARMATLSVPPVSGSLGQAVRPTLRTPPCNTAVCTEGWRLVGIEITHPRYDQMTPNVLDIANITGKTPIVTVNKPHGLRNFNELYVAGVQGMTGVNGRWQITVMSPTSFRLNQAQASGAYAGGGYVVHAVATVITGCTNASPIVCTTSTRHGLTNSRTVPIVSIDNGTLTLEAGHGLARHNSVAISESSVVNYNGLWAVDQVSGPKVKLRGQFNGKCVSNCGAVTLHRTVQVAGVEGNTAANGSHLFKVLSDTQIELPDASGNGSYTSGGFVTQNPDAFFQLLYFGPSSKRMVLDRCYLHGWGFPTRLVFGFDLEAGDSAIIDSYFEEINYWGPHNPISSAMEPGGRSATILTIGNLHRLKISNTAFLNSVGVPIFSQEFRSTPEMAPTDIEITRNLFFNSDRLRAGSSKSDGRHYPSWNMIEFKKGQRILIDGNVFDGCWADGTPTGPTLSFSPRGSKGGDDNIVSDVTITNNIFRRISHGIYVIGTDTRRQFSTNPTARFKISNNLFQSIDYWEMHSEPGIFAGLDLTNGGGHGGSALWAYGPIEDLEFTHNTILRMRGPKPRLIDFNFGRSSGFVVRYNVFPHNQDFRTGGGLPEANGFPDFVPAITGSPSDVFKKYFTYAPDPDPNSMFSDNVVIPGVRDTAPMEHFDSSDDSKNFTKSDCEKFYRGFANITCVGTGRRGETANQRLLSVFANPSSFQPSSALPGGAGIDLKQLEVALRISVATALKLGDVVEAARETAAALTQPLDARISPESSGLASAILKPAAAETNCREGMCTAGDEETLETLLANARCGSRIVLSAGESLRISRPISLPRLACPADNPLVITTTAEQQLPIAGGRITPSHSALFAKLEAIGYPGTIFISDSAAVRGIVFRGLELIGSDLPQSGPVLRLEQASDIVFDQCYVHGRDMTMASPGVVLSGERISLTNSFVRGFCALDSGPKTAALLASGAGPISFQNNYVEAAAAALAVDEGTSVEFRHNSVERPVSTNPCRAEWDGLPHSPGSLVEMQTSSRGVFEFNLFEDSWAGNLQYPPAVSLAAATDAIFRSNTFRGVSHAFSFGGNFSAALPDKGIGSNAPRIVIEGNRLESATAADGGPCGSASVTPLLQQASPLGDLFATSVVASGLTLRCNTLLETGSATQRVVSIDSPSTLAPGASSNICDNLPARSEISNLAVRSRGDQAFFEYQVSASTTGIPCVAELWPQTRSGTASLYAIDNMVGTRRAVAALIQPGSFYDYRLMCGGDLRKGTIQTPPAQPQPFTARSRRLARSDPAGR